MTLLFCIPTLGNNGSARYIRSITDGLTERGHTVIAARNSLMTLLLLLWYRIFKKVRVLVCATHASQLLLTLPARMIGMRILWVSYHIRSQTLRWNPIRPLLILLVRCATIVVPTNAVRDILHTLGFSTQRTTIVPPSIGNTNSWQTNIFGTLAEVKQPQFRKGALVVGAIAPLARHYGIEYLLQAIRLCRDVIPTIQCIIVGHGPERQQLQWLTERLDLKRNILLVGWNEESQKWLAHFDVLVTPAITHVPFDYIVLEAMAEGIPIISTTINGSTDAIEQSKTGMRVEPANPVMLSEAISNLYHHPDWRKEMGDRAKERVATHFSQERMIDQIERLFL